MAAPSKRELAEVFLSMAQEMSPEQLNKHIAAYLVQTRRTHELNAIAKEMLRLRYADGTVEVTASSAFPLQAATIQSIKKIFSSKETIINEVTDASLLGGVRLETSEEYLDLTVRNRLDALKAGSR